MLTHNITEDEHSKKSVISKKFLISAEIKIKLTEFNQLTKF